MGARGSRSASASCSTRGSRAHREASGLATRAVGASSPSASGSWTARSARACTSGLRRGAPGAFATLLRRTLASSTPSPTASATPRRCSRTPSASRCTGSSARRRRRAAGRSCSAPASLGTMAVAVLQRLHPDVRGRGPLPVPAPARGRAVARRRARGRPRAARRGPRGARLVVGRRRCVPRCSGLAMAYPGGVDVVYDTVGPPTRSSWRCGPPRCAGGWSCSASRPRGGSSGRPSTSRSSTCTGSSGFGVEDLGGVRRHAIDHYLAACADGLDLSGLVTHVDTLEGHYDLCAALAEPARSGVLKAAFAPTPG